MSTSLPQLWYLLNVPEYDERDETEVMRAIQDAAPEDLTFSYPPNGGVTLLMLTVYRRWSDRVLKAVLREPSQQLNAQHKGKWTAVYYAAATDNSLAVRLLAERGADLNIRKGCQLSPIHTAISNCKHDALQALLDCGACPYERGGIHRTALEYATRKNYGGEHVQILLKHFRERERRADCLLRLCQSYKVGWEHTLFSLRAFQPLVRIMASYLYEKVERPRPSWLSPPPLDDWPDLCLG